MITKGKHQKHPPLVRSTIGNYHRCEWGIYGTTCGKINSFYEEIKSAFSSQFNLAFVDADHKPEAAKSQFQIGVKKFQSANEIEWNSFDDRLVLENYNAVFVNGNHYPAKKQIVFIDPLKKESLLKRIDQLTDISLIIGLEKDFEIFDFLKEKITKTTQLIEYSDKNGIFKFLEKEILNSKVEIKALVLAGGKSKRMGFDKSSIVYSDGLSQEKKLAAFCEQLGLKTFISKESNFVLNEIDGIPVIKDKMVDMGPFGAIISAFIHDPNSAWLVVACDLPLLNLNVLKDLIDNRNVRKLATAIKGSNKEFPEPLIAIYEPTIYKCILKFLSLGYACPRKVLINSDIETVILENEEAIINVNTKEEKLEIERKYFS